MTRLRFMAVSAVIITTAIALLFIDDLQSQIIELNATYAAAEEYYQAQATTLQQELAGAREQVEFLSREGRYEQMDVAIFEIACHTAGEPGQTTYPEHWFTVAADPRVIKPGSMVWVEYFGWGVAEAGGDLFGYQVSVCVADPLLVEAWGELTEWGIVLWETKRDIFKPKGANLIANYRD